MTARLLGVVRTGYGTASLLEEVGIAAERNESGTRLLAAPTLEHWAEALEEAQRSQADDSHAGSQAQAPEPEQKTQKVAHAV